ncbi:MAG: hypothetical protein LBB13_02600 [Rickettsiales bacterium]|jgi:hypothetical protein|nr:hypothetical protein [Rickettsiales bacterium]
MENEDINTGTVTKNIEPKLISQKELGEIAADLDIGDIKSIKNTFCDWMLSHMNCKTLEETNKARITANEEEIAKSISFGECNITYEEFCNLYSKKLIIPKDGCGWPIIINGNSVIAMANRLDSSSNKIDTSLYWNNVDRDKKEADKAMECGLWEPVRELMDNPDDKLHIVIVRGGSPETAELNLHTSFTLVCGGRCFVFDSASAVKRINTCSMNTIRTDNIYAVQSEIQKDPCSCSTITLGTIEGLIDTFKKEYNSDPVKFANEYLCLFFQEPKKISKSDESPTLLTEETITLLTEETIKYKNKNGREKSIGILPKEFIGMAQTVLGIEALKKTIAERLENFKKITQKLEKLEEEFEKELEKTKTARERVIDEKLEENIGDTKTTNKESKKFWEPEELEKLKKDIKNAKTVDEILKKLKEYREINEKKSKILEDLEEKLNEVTRNYVKEEMNYVKEEMNIKAEIEKLKIIFNLNELNRAEKLDMTKLPTPRETVEKVKREMDEKVKKEKIRKELSKKYEKKILEEEQNKVIMEETQKRGKIEETEIKKILEEKKDEIKNKIKERMPTEKEIEKEAETILIFEKLKGNITINDKTTHYKQNSLWKEGFAGITIKNGTSKSGFEGLPTCKTDVNKQKSQSRLPSK